jgi:leucine dehydrogenase
MTLEADVLSPNALGAILTEESIAALRVPIVAGGANNQLATPADGQRIHQRGILYAPDYVINAGGIINVSTEYLGDGDAGGGQARGSSRSRSGSSRSGPKAPPPAATRPRSPTTWRCG